MSKRLSRHFLKAEFACNHCGKLPNNPPKKLLNILEDLRTEFDSPVIINSGYRCKIHNNNVGGVKNSRHMVGDAADVVVKGVDQHDVYVFLNNRVGSSGAVGKYNTDDNGVLLAQVPAGNGNTDIEFSEFYNFDFSITSVNSNSFESTPTEYKLAQNYPNPFNPSTTISFAIPNKANVKLSVYSSLGEKVTELLNENLSAGNHQVSFDASNLSSGLYFYKISAGNFINVKKMMLIK